MSSILCKLISIHLIRVMTILSSYAEPLSIQRDLWSKKTTLKTLDGAQPVNCKARYMDAKEDTS